MIAGLLGLLVIACVPGAVYLRLPVGDRARRAALSGEERAWWAVIVSVAQAVLLVLGLAAFGAYTFGRLVLLQGLCGLVLLAIFRRRLRWDERAARPTWRAGLIAALLAGAAWWFAPPAEYILGGRDPGVYLNEGVRLARLGALVVHEDVVRDVPPRVHSLFFPWHRTRKYYSLRFMGSLVLDPNAGSVVSQFPHAFPASIAIGYGGAGLTGARYVPLAWALLGLAALYFAIARVTSPAVGAAAVVLLALNVGQIWYARYPASEIMMQPLVLGGLLAFGRAHQDGDGWFAPVAGVLLGLPIFFRVEAVIVIAAVAAAMAVALIDHRRPRAAFVAAFAVTAGAGLLYLSRVTSSYFEYPRAVLLSRPWALGGAAAAALALLGALWYLGTRRALARSVKRAIVLALIALVLIAAAYAAFFRQPAGRLAPHDAYALRTFAAFYTTVPGFCLALAGYVLLVSRRFWQAPALLLTATAFSLFFFHKIRIVPEHFWVARRFVPVLLPAMAGFAAAAALAPAWIAVSRRWVRLGLLATGIGTLGVVASQLLERSRPIARFVEYEGVIAEVERLAQAIGDDDLVLVESRGASDVHVIGLPLSSIYGRRVLMVGPQFPPKAQLSWFLAQARQRYGRVLFLSAGETDLLSQSIHAEPLLSRVFRVPEYARPLNAFPDGVRQKEFRVLLSQFVDPPERGAPFTLDVGAPDDDLYLLRFYAPERTGAVTFRWTRRVSVITVLLRGGDRTVTLWLNSGGRPAAAPPSRSIVSLGDHQLGEVLVTDTFQPYTFPIPDAIWPEVARQEGSARLSLLTEPWVPADVVGGGDTRQLGVIVDRIEVR